MQKPKDLQQYNSGGNSFYNISYKLLDFLFVAED